MAIPAPAGLLVCTVLGVAAKKYGQKSCELAGLIIIIIIKRVLLECLCVKNKLLQEHFTNKNTK